MNQEAQPQQPSEATTAKKKPGRPAGTKNKRKYTRKAVEPVMTVPLATTSGVPIQELIQLAEFIDYWKKESNLTTLQCLRLFAL